MSLLVFFIIICHPIVLFEKSSYLLISDGSIKLAILFGTGNKIPKFCIFGMYIDFHF